MAEVRTGGAAAGLRPDGGQGAAAPANPSDAPPVTDRRWLRTVFGTFATGVTVVTVGGPAPHGMTANSFTSVSLDPPTVLVCVRDHAVMHDRIVSSRAFAVSVLGAHQEGVARHFADRGRGQGRAQFDPVGWVAGPRTGAPLIAGALAWVECRLWRTYDGGDHSIFLGRLLGGQHRADRNALLFLGGHYHRGPRIP